jgi:hypothetical protein
LAFASRKPRFSRVTAALERRGATVMALAMFPGLARTRGLSFGGGDQVLQSLDGSRWVPDRRAGREVDLVDQLPRIAPALGRRVSARQSIDRRHGIARFDLITD